MILRICISALLALALNACSSKPPTPAKEKAGRSSSYQLTRDGHYRIKRGDTLHAIAFNFGLDWRDLAQWNNIRSPDLIYPDQELRLSPPNNANTKTTRVTGTGKQPAASTRTAPASTQAPAKSPAKSSGKSSAKTSAKASTKSSTSAATGPDPNRWIWPTQGKIVSSFSANDSARKGIDIGGKAGQDVVASADGEVVYSGSGLIGYGELIIIKHSERMLSAYAHNRKRVVSEGQQVKTGNKIAEMGTNDRNQAMLHFEIRVNGSPANPQNFLPRR